MAIELKSRVLDDITEMLNYQSFYINLNIRYKLGQPFNEPNFLYTCAETLGYGELAVIEVYNDGELIDIIPFARTKEGIYKTPIPREIPHFLYFPSLSRYFNECFDFLCEKIEDYIITNTVFNEQDLAYLTKKYSYLNVNEKSFFVLEIPPDFERWIYRAKPKSQDKYAKIIKLLKKSDLSLGKWSDPLGVQEKISMALNKGTNLPLITKAAVSTLYFQLKLAGYEIEYTTLQAENYDLTGAILLTHGSNIYIFQMFNFTDERKNSIEELHLIKLLEVAAQEGKSKLILFSDIEPPILKYESIKIFDISFQKA
ncbi:MAG: hypothetical protein ABIM43_02555 [candidate division WOR-3 bacterium]